MPKLVLACLAANLIVPAGSGLGANMSEKAIFAGNDCCGRLANSQVSQVGEITSGSRRFTVYTLWFVDPESRHGMKHLAIAEGRQFVGSYIISSWATPSITENRVRFICEGNEPCDGEGLVIEDGVLPSRLWVDGEINELEDTI